MESNHIQHHGILGMKWGVRRYQNRDGSLTTAGKKRRRSLSSEDYHEDYKKAHTPKSVKTMSDAELRNRINRLNMEKQYSQLDPSAVNKGKSYMDKVIKVGTTVATVTTTGLTIYNNADKIAKLIKPMLKK